MRHLNKVTGALLAGLLLSACSQDEIVSDNSKDENINKGVTASVEDFKTEYDTRTALTLDEETGLTFKWTADDDDKVAVFGKTGLGQASMGISVGNEPTTATFNCESFQLVTTNSYCAYLPFSSNAEVDKTNSVAKVPVSFTGQTQTGNASMAHIGNYDYLVSDECTPTALNNCHFTFSHMGVALRLQITMPEAGNWKSVTLAAADGGQAFTTSAYLNLFDPSYANTALEAKETASSVTLSFSDGTNSYISTTSESSVLTAWIMLAPTTYFNSTEAKEMTVTVKSADGNSYVASITPNKKFKQGYAYSLDITTSSTPFLKSKFKVSDSKYVTFATGNLQYDIENSKYQLAENQWTTCVKSRGSYTLGSDNKHIDVTPYTTNNKILDLFAWGTANDPTYAYVNTLNGGNYYLGETDEIGNPSEKITTDKQSFSTSNDWGTVASKQIVGLDGARTLTADEWIGLVKNQCFAVASLTGQNIKGLVVFPYGMDETTAKGYLTTTSPKVYKYTGTDAMSSLSSQNITVDNLKTSGALFLPLGGYRANKTVSDFKSTGLYWSVSSAQTYGEAAYVLQVKTAQIQPCYYQNRKLGSSVRLVMDVTE